MPAASSAPVQLKLFPEPRVIDGGHMHGAQLPEPKFVGRKTAMKMIAAYFSVSTDTLYKLGTHKRLPDSYLGRPLRGTADERKRLIGKRVSIDAINALIEEMDAELRAGEAHPL